MIVQKELNGFFAPLNAKIRDLVRPFLKLNSPFDYEQLACMKNFSKMKNGKYYENSYPLPAILIKNYCIIIVSNSEIIVRTKMKAEKALNFDYRKLVEYDYEIYNPYDRNSIIWEKGVTKETFRRKMLIYEDNDVSFDFFFDFETEPINIYTFIKILKKNGFFLNS